MKRIALAAMTVAVSLAMGVVQAAPKSSEVFEPGKSLAEQIRKIEIQMNDGETYSELRLEDRSRVREALGRMTATLEQQPDQSTINAQAKTELFNDQQVVNTVLTRAREDSRLICRREKVVGSNLSTTQCQTVAQRERMKDQAQNQMGTAQRLGKSLID